MRLPLLLLLSICLPFLAGAQNNTKFVAQTGIPTSKDVTCAAVAPISCGETVTGMINGAEDCDAPFGDGTFIDRYLLPALAGQTLTIDLESDEFDAFLILAADTGMIIDQADGGGTGANAQLVFEVQIDGDYLIAPNNFTAGVEGAYELSVACTGGPAPGPVGLPGPADGVFRMAAGGAHTCLLNADVALGCFGYNRFGQLGIGNNESQLTALFAPTSMAIRSSGINDIAVGGVHSCLLTNDGDVYCWGSNSNGQLGEPLATDARLATPESPALSGVQSIDAGALHTCAVTFANEVFCWGHNAEGQLGNGTTVESATPVQVIGLTGIQDVFLGGLHSCAVDANANVHCWGSNNFGQAGDPSLADAATPVAVSGLEGPVAELAAGFAHTCALLGSGMVQCWGGLDLLVSKAVNGFSNITELTSGGYHVCGLTSGGGVLCAGLNDFDQLGSGDGIPSLEAQPVLGLESGVLTLDAGGSHTCAVTGDDQLVCWGDDRRGQLGDYDADFLIDIRKRLLGARRDRS